MKLLLSKPRGFCAGVVRAINTVEKALELWGAPIYVKHEIVHNKHVVEDLRNKGAIFIEDLDVFLQLTQYLLVKSTRRKGWRYH